MQMTKTATDLFKSLDSFHAITVGAYKMMGRLQDVPLTTAYTHQNPQTCAPFDDIFALAYQSAAIGYCFADQKDHMSTTAIPDEATRDRLAAEGEALIDELVRRMDMPHVVDPMRKLEAYNDAVAAAKPWMPSAGKKKV